MGAFETMTRAERLGINQKVAKKKTPKKKKFMTWSDFEDYFDDSRNATFRELGLETLGKVVDNKKTLELVIESVNKALIQVIDDDNKINVSASVLGAYIPHKAETVIYEIKKASSSGKNGQSDLCYRSDYVSKKPTVYEIVDNAFDTLLGIVRAEYSRIVKKEFGEKMDY